MSERSAQRAAQGTARGRRDEVVSLTQLSPDLIGRALRGELAKTTTIEDLLDAATHLDWLRQRV